jgi:hypothetical protein
MKDLCELFPLMSSNKHGEKLSLGTRFPPEPDFKFSSLLVSGWMTHPSAAFIARFRLLLNPASFSIKKVHFIGS